jgi:2-dehydropantoate 2-reductase
MRLAVVGAGAMGGSLAAHASRAGHEVTIVDVSPAVLKQVNHAGVSVEAPEGRFTAHVAATDDPTKVGVVDVVVVFVKAEHTDAAARSLQSLIGAQTAIVTLQNGWGNADRIAGHVPSEQLVVGVTYNSCTSTGPGTVVHSGRGVTMLGAYRGGNQRFAERAAELLSGSGWQAEVSGNVRTEIWKKLVLNAATLPTAALSRLNAGDLGEPGELRDLVDGLAAETVMVARAQDLDIDLAERVQAIHATLDRAGSGKASMLQDVLAGRKTEVETVNGAVVTAGTEHSIPVPLNRAMVALVHGLERSYLS